MSQVKVEWATGLPLKDRTLKLVMIQLCDAFTEAQGCFPSVSRLAARCATSERSVQRALRRLEIKGLIGRQFTARTTRYLLNFAWVSPVTDSVTPDKLAPVTNQRPTGDTYVTPGVTTGVTLTTEPTVREPEAPPVVPPREDLFDEQADSDDRTAMGLGRIDLERGGEQPDAAEAVSGQPAPGRNGKARRARVGLTLEHAAEAGLIPKERANGRLHALPADWCPSPAGRDYAEGLGLDADKVREAFVDHWTSSKGCRTRRPGWERSWRVWCDREQGFRGVGQGKARPLQPARGNGAFYDQLAIIAARARDNRERDGA